MCQTWLRSPAHTRRRHLIWIVDGADALQDPEWEWMQSLVLDSPPQTGVLLPSVCLLRVLVCAHIHVSTRIHTHTHAQTHAHKPTLCNTHTHTYARTHTGGNSDSSRKPLSSLSVVCSCLFWSLMGTCAHAHTCIIYLFSLFVPLSVTFSLSRTRTDKRTCTGTQASAQCEPSG